MAGIKRLYLYTGSIILSLFTLTAAGQSFLNLDFEYSAEKDQPRKWAVEGEGNYYFARLDQGASFNGKNSLHVTQKTAQVYTFLRIPGNDLAGKTIKFEGHML